MMNLWSFIFCDPAWLQSARVAAPTRAVACAQLSSLMDCTFDPTQTRLGANVILQHAGKSDLAEPAVVSVVMPDGQTILNEDVT